MGPKRTITTQLGVGRYTNGIRVNPQPRCGDWVFFCLTRQSHGIQRGRCVYMGEGGVCDVPHQIGEKVPDAIYVEVPLNQVDAF